MQEMFGAPPTLVVFGKYSKINLYRNFQIISAMLFFWFSSRPSTVCKNCHQVSTPMKSPSLNIDRTRIWISSNWYSFNIFPMFGVSTIPSAFRVHTVYQNYQYRIQRMIKKNPKLVGSDILDGACNHIA